MNDLHSGVADYVGLRTDNYAHYAVSGQRVEWVAWDSPARCLAIGDIVLSLRAGRRSLSGARLPRLNHPGSSSTALWAALDVAPGSALTFTVRRGDDVLEHTVDPIAHPLYQSADGKRALFPEGPYALSRTQIGETWSVWYERIVKDWSQVLCDGWRRRTLDTRKRLEAHADERRSVDDLLDNHPGPFADHVAARWADVQVCLAGRAWREDTIDLSWRDLAKGRRERIKSAARKTHQAFETQLSEQLRDAFPAPDPYQSERGTVEGRLVAVDRVSPRNMRGDGVEAWYILGDKYKGWYFLDVYSPEVMRMWDAIEAYKRQVTQQLPEHYRFYLRILEAPMIRTRERRTVACGFKTQLVAALVGGELFVSALDTDAPSVAGSEILQTSAIDPPPDCATPEALAARRIEAMKLLRKDVWEALFADWNVSSNLAADTVYLPYGQFGPTDKRSGWEQAQKRLFKDVLDIKIASVSDPYTVLPGDTQSGTPEAQECEVIVEHVGEFDGEYRSFKDQWLTRAWRLQRVGGGPWRFVYPRGL